MYKLKQHKAWFKLFSYIPKFQFQLYHIIPENPFHVLFFQTIPSCVTEGDGGFAAAIKKDSYDWVK